MFQVVQVCRCLNTLSSFARWTLLPRVSPGMSACDQVLLECAHGRSDASDPCEGRQKLRWLWRAGAASCMAWVASTPAGGGQVAAHLHLLSVSGSRAASGLPRWHECAAALATTHCGGPGHVCAARGSSLELADKSLVRSMLPCVDQRQPSMPR